MKTIWVIRSLFLLLILAILLFAFRSPIVWKWMYPVYYPGIVKENAMEFNHNPNLILAIIHTESNFAHDKTSKKGAIGLMQLMGETAEWIMAKGKYPSDYRNSLHTPAINIELGSWYLRYLLELYDHNLIMTLAAYNAGPGNVNKWLTSGIWDGKYETLQQIPYGETRHYIQRVLYTFDRYERIYNDRYWQLNRK